MITPQNVRPLNSHSVLPCHSSNRFGRMGLRTLNSSHASSLKVMIEKQYYSTGTKWEPIVGYSRALRVGNLIYVTGTTATDERGEIVAVGDAYAQTVQVIHNIERALAALGASLKDVVRTRMFVIDISRWEEYGRAHGEFFGEIKPCTTMVEVRRLIDDRMLIEIEVDAVLTAPLPH